jgi:hypothetical protein
MQAANLTSSSCVCWIWAWVVRPAELDALDAPDELGELEPQAAITVATVIAAATLGRLEVVLNMAQVVPGGQSHQCNTRALTGSAERGGGV